jgi:hypothetical protein
MPVNSWHQNIWLARGRATATNNSSHCQSPSRQVWPLVICSPLTGQPPELPLLRSCFAEQAHWTHGRNRTLTAPSPPLAGLASIQPARHCQSSRLLLLEPHDPCVRRPQGTVISRPLFQHSRAGLDSFVYKLAIYLVEKTKSRYKFTST